MSQSLIQQLVTTLGPEAAFDSLAASLGRPLTPELLTELRYDWSLWARPEQLEPTPTSWDIWLILSGRGWGKTRTGAQWVRSRVEARTAKRIALLAPTFRDCRNTLVEGESGLLASCPPGLVSSYEPGLGRVSFSTGAVAYWYSAEEPERLRGPQFDLAWCDELAAWSYLEATWDQLRLATRLGSHPQMLVTTTPKPLPLIKRLLKDLKVRVTRGSTFDNAANLPESYLTAIEGRFGGTRLGRQELYGEVLEDTDGALWSATNLDAYRVREAPELTRIVVGVDPAVTATGSSDETGIVVAGRGRDGHLYILGDHSGRMSVEGWARKVVDVFDHYQADIVVGETNQGGDLVERSLKQVRPYLPFRSVRATRGKLRRAEPVALMYEQGRAHHVGVHHALEDQLVSYTPLSSESPDRLDALVWACTELLGEAPATFGDADFRSPSRTF